MLDVGELESLEPAMQEAEEYLKLEGKKIDTQADLAQVQKAIALRKGEKSKKKREEVEQLLAEQKAQMEAHATANSDLVSFPFASPFSVFYFLRLLVCLFAPSDKRGSFVYYLQN